MSRVSFLDADITGVRFSDMVCWGGEDNYKVIEEEWLEQYIKEPNEFEEKKISLGGVLSVYRNLRDNYEFRRRYDEAGKFFIKEMELKRKYRETPNVSFTKIKFLSYIKKLKRDKTHNPKVEYILRENKWPRRNISLTRSYHFLSKYGESLLRPILVGIAILVFSTFLFVTQSNPNLIPTWPISFINHTDNLTSAKYTLQPAGTVTQQ